MKLEAKKVGSIAVGVIAENLLNSVMIATPVAAKIGGFSKEAVCLVDIGIGYMVAKKTGDLVDDMGLGLAVAATARLVTLIVGRLGVKIA